MKTRGFTLMELMITVSILPIAMAAVGTLYLEGRVATTRIESQVQLTRSLSLAHERIARDLRAASRVELDGALRLHTPEGTVRYEASDRGLVRSVGTRDRVIARRVREISVTPTATGFDVEITAIRRLVGKRRLRMTRSSFVARRR